MSAIPPDEVRARFERDGYVAPIDIFSAAEAGAYRERLERLEAEHADALPVADIFRSEPHYVVTLADELVHHPAILDVAQAVLGPDLLCWSTDFFIKDARQPGYVTWHQDLTYWGLDGTDEATAWVALSPSTVQSGCMRVYPGSHKRDIVPHRDTFASDNMLSRGQRLAEEIDESKAADLVLAPGQISLHHGRIFHASGPNRSDDRRIGFAIRYIAPSMRQARGTGAWAHLVRGTDEYRHFEHLPRPRVDFEPGALAMRARIVGAMEEVLYDGAAESGNRQQVTGSS